jgi:predicted porin
MRTFLLASAAAVGLAGTAAAQAPAPAAAPLPVGVNGVPAAPTTYLGGNNVLNQDGGALPQSPSTPTPGSMVVHINGRVWGYLGVGGGSGYNVNGNKIAPAQWIGYFRLYPGVDALATNGLRYGAIVEIRQNFIGQQYGLTINNPAGSAPNNGAGGNYSTSPSGDSSASTLYLRREAVYVGSDQVGIFRLGQDDGPFSQYDNGITTFQFGSGAWNGDGPDILPTNSQPTFPWWSGIGAEYDTAKLAYFSPRFYGFDIGMSFAFNNAANNAAACPVAAAGCANLSSSLTNFYGGGARPRNWYEIMGRYQGNFAGLGIYAIAGYSGSGHTNVPPAFQQFNGFSVGDAGIALTYAGFTVGGNVLAGNLNGQVALQPQGGVHAIGWLAGVQYATGPITLAASYYNYQEQGSTAMVGISQRYDDALAAGITYAVAPGLNAYAEYLYGQVHQGDVNVVTGTNFSAAGNNAHQQALILGTRVQW